MKKILFILPALMMVTSAGWSADDAVRRVRTRRIVAPVQTTGAPARTAAAPMRDIMPVDMPDRLVRRDMALNMNGLFVDGCLDATKFPDGPLAGKSVEMDSDRNGCVTQEEVNVYMENNRPAPPAVTAGNLSPRADIEGDIPGAPRPGGNAARQ